MLKAGDYGRWKVKGILGEIIGSKLVGDGRLISPHQAYIFRPDPRFSSVSEFCVGADEFELCERPADPEA